MQFFRDSLSNILTSKTTTLRSPVLEALAEAVSAHPNLDFSCLHTLVDSRDRDLSYPAVPSLTALVSLAADLQAPTIEAHALALLSTCEEDRGMLSSLSEDVSIASRFSGEAVGLAVLLRGAAAHAANRLSYAPGDVARDQNVDVSQVMASGPAAAGVYSVVAERATRSLELAHDAVSELPIGVRPAFWGLTFPRIYLPQLMRAGGDPFDEGLQQKMLQTYPLRLQLALLRRRLFG